MLTQTRTALLVAFWAGLGAMTRHAWIDIATLSLLAANALGCFFIVFVPPSWKPFLGTGFLGGFTSFSAFILATDSVISGAISIVVCVGSWFLGDLLKTWVLQ
jgi:hypothetical protein